jgi:acyl dehydratase
MVLKHKEESTMAKLEIDEIEIGDSHSEEVLFDLSKIQHFIEFSNDSAGIHVNDLFSKEKGFDDLVIHGFLLSTQFSRILGMEIPGENTVIGSVNLDFHSPVYVGDSINFSATVERIIKPLGSVKLKLKADKKDGTLCVEGKTVCVFKKLGN